MAFAVFSPNPCPWFPYLAWWAYGFQNHIPDHHNPGFYSWCASSMFVGSKIKDWELIVAVDTICSFCVAVVPGKLCCITLLQLLGPSVCTGCTDQLLCRFFSVAYCPVLNCSQVPILWSTHFSVIISCGPLCLLWRGGRRRAQNAVLWGPFLENNWAKWKTAGVYN